MRPRLRKLLKAALIGAALLLLAAAGLSTWLVRRAWPELHGRLVLPGLQAEVQVVRDTWGVPHIYARDERDLYLAEGYVHAQDRLWQMHFNRMVASGLLASFLGAPALEADHYMRTLGLRRAAERDWALLDSDTRAALEAYAQGVNAYVDAHRGRLPVEFVALRTQPQTWTALDSLTFAKLMAFNLGMNHYYEIARERMRRKAGDDVTRRFIPTYPADAPLIVPPNARVAADGRVSDARPAWLPALVAGPTGGSNAWVVHGSRTASGRPLLVNDTHLALTMPSIWYENGLHGGALDAIGFALPGMPGIVIGHNQRIAWGMSNMCSDMQDLYRERLDDPAHPRRYQFQGEWKDLTVIDESIPVAGAADEKFTVRLTQHGPLVGGLFPDLTGPEGLALRWSALDGGQLAAAVLRLDRARDWSTFREALRLWDAPSLNFVYADVDGHVGYQSGGHIPARVPTHDGAAPVPGWEGQHEWQGYIPFDELPSVFDPPQGFVVTANNKIVGDDYPYPIGVDYADPYRARHLTELLSSNGRLSVDDARRVQAETTSLLAAELRPYVAALEPRTADERRALELLRAWDLREDPDRAGAAVFNVWYFFFVSRLAHNVVGDDLWKLDKQLYMSFGPMYTRLMSRPDDPFFDDRATPRVERRDDVVRSSFEEALAWLRQALGADMARWSWGAIHQAVFAHQPLGASGIGPLERLFNGRAVPARGGLFTIDTALPNTDKPFSVFFGASQRMIIDFAQLDGSLSVNSTGQSERLFHRHRDDQVEAWESVQYHPMLSSREAVTRAGTDVLTLTPR